MDTLRSIVPFANTQDVFGWPVVLSVNGALLSLTAAADVEVQPPAPVTVTMYVPADSPERSSVVAKFDHKYVYVPGMDTLRSIVPFADTQDVFDWLVVLSVNGALLSLTAAVDVEVQPPAPVTVTV